MKLIETKTLSSAATSISFTSIPQIYTDLFLTLSLRDTGTNADNKVFNTVLSFNGSTSNFSSRALYGQGTVPGDLTAISNFGGWHPDNGATANVFGNTSVYISNYTSSANKAYSMDNVTENNGTTAFASIMAGLWSNSSAITSFTFTTSGTNLAIGSTASLYGITKA